MKKLFSCFLVVSFCSVFLLFGCRNASSDETELSLGSSPTQGTASSSSSSETTIYPFITEPAGSSSGGEDTEPTPSRMDDGYSNFVSVPVAGISFNLPDGWTLFSATNNNSFFINEDGTEFLNVMTGVNAVPQIATGTESGLYSYVNEHLPELCINTNGYIGKANGLDLQNDTESSVDLGSNLLSEETFTFHATLSGTALDEYGKLVAPPDYPSLYYAFARTDTPTGIILVLSKTADSSADLQADLASIISSLYQYADTLDDYSFPSQTFTFSDLGIAFDLPEGYVATTNHGAYKIALETEDASSPLYDIQVNVYIGFEGENDSPTDVCAFLMENEFYYQYWGQEGDVPENISELATIATDGQTHVYPLGDQTVYGYQTRLLSVISEDDKLNVLDAGSFYFTTYAFRNGSTKIILTISGPNNASSMVKSVQSLMSGSFVFF